MDASLLVAFFHARIAMAATKDYVGVAPCGCVVAWARYDIPQRTLKRRLAEWRNDGLSIERMDTEEAKKVLGHCKCKRDSS